MLGSRFWSGFEPSVIKIRRRVTAFQSLDLSIGRIEPNFHTRTRLEPDILSPKPILVYALDLNPILAGKSSDLRVVLPSPRARKVCQFAHENRPFSLNISPALIPEILITSSPNSARPEREHENLHPISTSGFVTFHDVRSFCRARRKSWTAKLPSVLGRDYRLPGDIPPSARTNAA